MHCLVTTPESLTSRRFVLGGQCTGCWIYRDFSLFTGIVTRTSGSGLGLSSLPMLLVVDYTRLRGGEQILTWAEVPRARKRVGQRWEICVVQRSATTQLPAFCFNVNGRTWRFGAGTAGRDSENGPEAASLYRP